MTTPHNGLYKLSGLGLVGYGLLFLASGLIDLAAGPPPSSGADILAWVEAHQGLLAFPSELLFFQAAFLVPGTIGLYQSLAGSDRAKAVMGCGLMGLAISVMSLLAIVHGRLAYPVYGIRANTPDSVTLVVALYFGGLHAISLLIGFALVPLGLAMRRGLYGKPLAGLAFIAAALAVAGAYPYILGPVLTLLCQAVVAAWFLAVGRHVFRLG